MDSRPAPPVTPWPARLHAGATQGLRAGMVAGFCYWSSGQLGLHEGYWSAISSIVVSQGDLQSTVSASRDRLLGTVIGGLFGWAVGSIWGGQPWVYGLAIGVATAFCAALNLGAAGRLTGVTMSVITLIPRSGAIGVIALHRFVEVAYGVTVALAVAAALARLARPAGGAPTPIA